MVRVDVPQGVADSQRLVCLGQMGLPPGGPPDPLPEDGIWGQVVIQFHRHCVVNIIKCHKLPPVFVEYFLIIYYIQLRRICQFSKRSDNFMFHLVLFNNFSTKTHLNVPGQPNPEPPAPQALLHCLNTHTFADKIFRNHLLPSCNGMYLDSPAAVLYNIRQNRL